MTRRLARAIEYRFTGSLLDPEELVEFVDFRADLFARLQSHDDKLAVLGRVKHAAEFAVLDSRILDVLRRTFHGGFALRHVAHDRGRAGVHRALQRSEIREAFPSACTGRPACVPIVTVEARFAQRVGARHLGR